MTDLPINSDLSALLETLRGRKVKFHVNPGNAGDSLIAAATFSYFAKRGIEFEQIGAGWNLDGGILLVGGGGNLVPLYDPVRRILLEYAHKVERVIILPHTIRGHEDVLATLRSNTTIFCRDPEGYLHVLEHAATPDVHLGHDMAFHFVPDEVLALATPEWESGYKSLTGNRDYGKHPTFARQDGERRVALPDSTDISQLYGVGVAPGEAEFATYCLMRAMDEAVSVTTDRLHVAILAGLLGKEVRLFNNSYGKNRSVYFHSIRRFLPSVTFVDA